MTNRPSRHSDPAPPAHQVIRGRTVLIMLLLGVPTFTVLFWKLYDLQTNRHDELKAEAVSQQTDSMVISASRGTVYDKNGEIMAISYSTETIYIDPRAIESFVESQETAIEEAAKKAAVCYFPSSCTCSRARRHCLRYSMGLCAVSRRKLWEK